VQAKTFFVAEMMCKQLIFCVKAATRLATGATKILIATRTSDIHILTLQQ
jgi:hypothetical protein